MLLERPSCELRTAHTHCCVHLTRGMVGWWGHYGCTLVHLGRCLRRFSPMRSSFMCMSFEECRKLHISVDFPGHLLLSLSPVHCARALFREGHSARRFVALALKRCSSGMHREKSESGKKLMEQTWTIYNSRYRPRSLTAPFTTPSSPLQMQQSRLLRWISSTEQRITRLSL